MDTDIVKLIFLGVNFCVMVVTMATSHLVTGRYIPIFGLSSLIFILSFGKIFSFFATLRK